MKKELKQLIKEKKLSDDDLIKLINPPPPAESEQDVKDEADDDESESQSDSKETGEADAAPAIEKPQTLSPKDVEKIVAKAISQALKAQTKNAEKPVDNRKPAPNPTPPPEIRKLGGFQIRTE